MSLITGERCHGTEDGIQTVCPCMQECIQPSGSGKGIKYLIVLNKKTLTMKMFAVYGIGHRKDAFMNYCPFCGGELKEAASCPE